MNHSFLPSISLQLAKPNDRFDTLAALHAQQTQECAAASLQNSLEGGVVGLNAPLGARRPGEQPLPEQGAAQRAAARNAGLDGLIHRPAAQWEAALDFACGIACSATRSCAEGKQGDDAAAALACL